MNSAIGPSDKGVGMEGCHQSSKDRERRNDSIEGLGLVLGSLYAVPALVITVT